jgi:hypothetical protein
MQQRDPDRVTHREIRTADSSGTGIMLGLAIAALVALGAIMFWPRAETSKTVTTDSTRIERPATPVPNTPPANKPVTDTKPAQTPPAKAPAQ